MWHDCGRSRSYVGGSVQTKDEHGHPARRQTHVDYAGGRNGDKTSLMARLKTTPWSRKKQAMVKKEQLQEPPCAPEEESAPAGKPRAAYGGEEHTVASRRSIDETWPSCVGWTSRSWEMSLVRGMTNENLSSSPFRQMMANG